MGEGEWVELVVPNCGWCGWSLYKLGGYTIVGGYWVNYITVTYILCILIWFLISYNTLSSLTSWILF